MSLSFSFSFATSSVPHPSLSGPMSRWLFPWSGSIKKRACRYLLQHYLGHFLEERLSLDQLSLDLYNGSGVIKEINLDVWVSEFASLAPRLSNHEKHLSSVSQFSRQAENKKYSALSCASYNVFRGAKMFSRQANTILRA